MTAWHYDVDDFDQNIDDDFGDKFNEYEDEREALRGTSQCDGLCIPQCSWCLVSHACPDDCAGGECPYDALAKEEHVPREAQCLCQWEAGDSPCPIHGEEEIEEDRP